LLSQKRFQACCRELIVADSKGIRPIKQHGAVLNCDGNLLAGFGVLHEEGAGAQLKRLPTFVFTAKAKFVVIAWQKVATDYGLARLARCTCTVFRAKTNRSDWAGQAVSRAENGVINVEAADKASGHGAE
jgi:hypothetical protein